jgi:3-oxoacyl-[acyl-carrier-protein] synthase-3
MVRTEFISTGFYVPERVVTNQELEGYMALRAAGMEADEIDCIILATLSPDHFFPGTGVFLQRELGLRDIPCLDIRNQCTGFIYGLQVADAWIRTGQYRRVLLVGTEVHSSGIILSNEGRDTAVLFGDGAGVAILGPSEEDGRGVLAVRTHADGRHAENLWAPAPACVMKPFITKKMIDEGMTRPRMQGREVFKHAVTRMPAALHEVLDMAGHTADELDMVIPHQANMRIAQAVQKSLGLPEERMYVNIQRYGNTTAASIPIALHECVAEGRIQRGDLVGLTAFGSGFTWGGALVRW